MKEIMNVLNSNLKSCDTVIVACSTGPDSMCLLSLIMQLNIKIVVAHVNHNVRKQSQEEYQYLENYCKNNNLIFEGLELNNLSLKNFEAEARKKRYQFFNTLRKKYNAKYIITAHHADDLIETVLMRISRGSNLSGYAGIKMIDKYYFRPLLFVNKENILEYLTQKNIKYYTDVTNNSDEHTRNRYRHFVVPFLKKETSDIGKKYLNFSNELQEYDNFVKNYVLNKQIINNNIIDLNKLRSESDFIKRKTLEILISKYQENDVLDISQNTISEILNLISGIKPNGKVFLNNGYYAIRNYEYLTISQQENILEFNSVFKNKFENSKWLICQKKTNDTSNFTIRLSSKEIKLPIIIRNKIAGDVIEIKNLGHKKIKDIFIDNKISTNNRNDWPIVTDSSGIILWVPGLKKSKFDKYISQKYDIILTSERKMINE